MTVHRIVYKVCQGEEFLGLFSLEIKVNDCGVAGIVRVEVVGMRS